MTDARSTDDCLIHNVRVWSANDRDEFGTQADTAVAIRAGKISWVGEGRQATTRQAATRVDAKGAWLTPGLIDCHTHLVYAGNRAAEFADRLRGVSYADIARRGGGILSTVAATRAASEQTLFDLSLPRLQTLAAEGVCTLEIKSGYGLDLDNELKMLRVARALGAATGIKVVTTLLAAHALPPEYDGRADAYIDLVCEQILPAAAEQGLADAVDVFCEPIAFSAAQCRRVFEQAGALGLPVKGHVEQLSHSGGAQLVAAFKGLSADHVEYLQAADIGLLKASGTVAVLLPGAFYSLRETRKPPVAALREAGVPMAVATDLNPGSSPIASLRLAMNMACVLFGLSLDEALAGVSRHAAQALGLGQSKGRIAPGFDADLVLWAIDTPAELAYGHQLVAPAAIWRGGKRVD